MVYPLQPRGMNNQRLHKLIEGTGTDVQGELGYWQFIAHGAQVWCITDETHDRMRVMAPIAEIENVTTEEIHACMEANFDRALDARYCMRNGQLFGAYIHPLSPLTENQFLSAVHQVVAVEANFGSTYSSSELFFGG